MTLHVGGKEIQILYFGRAHTTGDSIVFVPQDRIAYLSELFFCEEFPNMAQGYGVSWLRVLDGVQSLDAGFWCRATVPFRLTRGKPGRAFDACDSCSSTHETRFRARSPRGERRSGGRRGEAPAV